MIRTAIRTWAGLFTVGFWALAIAAPSTEAPSASMAQKPATRVMLIGASIGQDWNLPDLPKRIPVNNFEFEAVQAWQFDKSEALENALARPARKFQPKLSYVKGFFKPAPKPVDLIVLKECSSYFPSDMQRNRELVQRWVGEIKAAGKPVILATTVPVTQSRATRDPGKQEAVRDFNDWLRGFAKAQDLPLMDLEAALRTDDKARFLRDELTSGDGSHLNRSAYAILDKLLVSTLCHRDKSNPCAGDQAMRSQ